MMFAIPGVSTVSSITRLAQGQGVTPEGLAVVGRMHRCVGTSWETGLTEGGKGPGASGNGSGASPAGLWCLAASCIKNLGTTNIAKPSPMGC